MSNNSILRNLIALTLIPGLGSKRIKSLLLECEQLENLFSLSKTQLRSYEGLGEATALSILTFDKWKKVDEIMASTEQAGVQLLSLADERYPRLLKEIYDPPILLWVQGNIEALSRLGVAIVGTRNASTYGKKQAAQLSVELAEQGLCIFSGLAYGIDTIAHQSALKANAPTVAVLGSGIDKLYPRANAELAKEIVASGGAIVSEYPMGTMAEPGYFPIRNRIVSGLSLGVLVIESGIKGGSMITAELGLDQNREVFAIPHPLGNMSGTGCNYLIKKGAAKLVQVVDDVLVELPIDFEADSVSITNDEPSVGWREYELDELSTAICSQLENGAIQIDALADTLEVNTSSLLVALLQLEMQDLVVQKAGKIFELR